MSVAPKHGPMCSIMWDGGEPIDYEKACRSIHCAWCGEPTSSQGHNCPAKRLGELPPPLGCLPDEGQIDAARAAVAAALLVGVSPGVKFLLMNALTHLAGRETP